MPTVLITGSSTGIGEECALRLNRMGWHVFAGVRRDEDGAALRARARNKSLLTPILLDVTDSASISSARQSLENAVGDTGLHGLVNNAGIAVAAPLEFVSISELRKQLEVNVVGPVAITQAVIPLLRMARGRIVNIGSVSGRIAAPLVGPYSASKFALDALTDTLRMELRPWHIHVAYVQPSSILTPIWSKALADANRVSQQMSAHAEILYGPIMAYMRNMAIRSQSDSLPAHTVGRAVAHALFSPKPKTRYLVGTTAFAVELLRILPDRLRNRLIRSQFK
jgi:NAD(P)-dependent dehydrogenase (short-subunit alcohol dehydrogenase family)